MSGEKDERGSPEPLIDETERKRRQRMRSIAIALALGFLVVMFYVATMVRMGGNVLNRPM